MDRQTIPQTVYDSDVRYVPKWISVLITVISVDNLNLVPKHIMTSKSESPCFVVKVRKAAKIRNQYNQVPHLTQEWPLNSH